WALPLRHSSDEHVPLYLSILSDVAPLATSDHWPPARSSFYIEDRDPLSANKRLGILTHSARLLAIFSALGCSPGGALPQSNCSSQVVSTSSSAGSTIVCT